MPPVANNVSTTTLEGTALTLNVLADASDPDGYTLSLASFTQPAHGTVTKNSDSDAHRTPQPRLPGGRLVHLHGFRRPRQHGHGHGLAHGRRPGDGRQLAGTRLRALCRYDALPDVQPGDGDADGRDQVFHAGVHHGRFEQCAGVGRLQRRTRSTAARSTSRSAPRSARYGQLGGDVSVSFGGEAGSGAGPGRSPV